MSVMRVHLKAKNRTGVALTLFLPVRDGFIFDPTQLAVGEWPAVHGIWDGEVWGQLDWDEETGLAYVEWSDNDMTSVDLKPGLELYEGRILTFTSTKFRTPEEMVVDLKPELL